jgi:tetratricopeptide (TPR) repeat protein
VVGARGRLLAAAAVIGDRFPLELAGLAAGIGREEAIGALASCVEARLLREGTSGPSFASALIREEVLASLGPERRASLHRAVAEALEAAAERPGTEEAAPDVLAWHWREAFQGPRAFRHLVAAGHRAAACGGLREALGFHETALALVGQLESADGAEPFELLESIGRARLGLGELEGAVDAFRSAIAAQGPDGWRPAPEQLGRARRCAALTLATAGDLSAAHRELDVGLAQEEGGGEEASSLHLLRARLHWHVGRFGLARAAADACAVEAERLGQNDLLLRARDLVALARDATGDAPSPPAERTGPLERRHSDPIADPAFDAPLLLWDGALVGDLPAPELLRLAVLELARCRARGDGDAAAAPLFASGSLLLAMGDAVGAGAALDEALGSFRAAGSAIGEALTLERMGVLRDRLGKLVEGMEILADGLVVAERATLRRHLVVRLLCAQAENRLAAGSIHDAEVIAREATDCAMRHGLCAVCETALRPLLVRIAVDRDRLDEAATEARILEELAAARGGRVLRATAQLARSRVSAALGRREEALALLAEARAVFDPLGRRDSAALCARAQARLGGSAHDASLEALLTSDPGP